MPRRASISMNAQFDQIGHVTRDSGNPVGSMTGWASYDPYDLWALPNGIRVRKAYYEGKLLGRFGAVAFGFADWLSPHLARSALNVPKKLHPITAGLLATRELRGDMAGGRSEVERFWLSIFCNLAALPDGKPYWAWGLGFPWMSKNGLYGPEVPFVTHTPYVMEALSLMESEKAGEMLDGTWNFLEALLVMEESQDQLALSYAPVREPRIVVNANSYAAFSYALHASRGRLGAMDRALRLTVWVKNQQEESGEWWYYADRDPGNFVDCFHSCFVVKNMIKTVKLIPEAHGVCAESIERGWAFIRKALFDERTGLCKRFVVRDIRDPFVWDLYDQAEFLGLLVDFGQLDEAQKFREMVRQKFHVAGDWYVRIDFFNRRWGKNFLRWGVVPFLYNEARLEAALQGIDKGGSNSLVRGGESL